MHKSGLHLDLVKKVEFGMDIARGMSCLHAQRPAIIHRDLKTANLLVCIGCMLLHCPLPRDYAALTKDCDMLRASV